MLRIYKLIFSTSLFSFTLSSDIEIKKVRVSWYDSGEQCNVTGLKTAAITEIESTVSDKTPCIKGEGQNIQYWIKNDYTFSNMISVEGCFVNNDLQASIPHQSLLGCYQWCSHGANEFNIFAFKNGTGGLNCICNLTAPDANTKNLEEMNISVCITLQKPWWKYKIHKNVFTTSNKTCRTISCTDIHLNDHFRRDILCGSFREDRIPNENLLYVCNTDEKLLSNTFMPKSFSFMLNASIAKDLNQSQSVFTKCQAIRCLKEFIYETIVTDCTSNMSGVICLNGNTFPLHSTNTPFKSSFSSINASKDMSHQPSNSSLHTPAREMSTVSASKEMKTYASSGSKLVHGASTPAYTKSPEQITKFATIPGAPDVKFPMTYISSDLNNHVTRSSKENIIHSTSHEVLNQNVNGDSPIGLIVGLLLSALVIVVIIVLLVVCRFKRKRPFRNKRYGDDSQITKFHNPNVHEKDIASIKKAHTVQNSTYDMHKAIENENEFSLSDLDSINLNNTPNSEYAVVTKNRQLICNTTTQQQNQNEENLDEAENEYDGLNHKRPGSFNSRTNSNNIYDTSLCFREQSDSTYVTAKHVHAVDKDENSVYDHM